MTTKEDGGPAFAQAFAMSPKLDQGMSLRDYFAAKAMPAIYAFYRILDFTGFAANFL